MKNAFLFIGLFIVHSSAHGQFSRYIIEFTDKGESHYTLTDSRSYLSQRAIERRSRQAIPLDSTDIPVHKAYIDSVRSINGLEILQVSKWLNAVLIRVVNDTIPDKLNRFPFIKRKRPIASQRIPQNENPLFYKFLGMDKKSRSLQSMKEIRNISGALSYSGFDNIAGRTHSFPGSTVKRSFAQSADIVEIDKQNPSITIQNFENTESYPGQEEFDYGLSAPQIDIHEGRYLHEKGFSGQGMLIAMLDAGYQGIHTNPVLDSMRNQNRLLGGFDFVDNQDEISTQHAHGAYCLTILAANQPGKMVGSAPHASYLLYRTENAAEEFPIEEFFWTCAAEKADSIGADMISSSLGYSSFENPVFNYSYAEKDGNTAISTIAADLAAKKGMIVCNSAGNSGTLPDDEKYISAPADGDSVIAIGAIQPNKTIASFSSWGPRPDGRIKPDLVSIGQGTTLARPDGTIVSGNGTSYSNPNLAGLIACLWQAFPEFRNMEIINAVKRSSDRYENPDERFGYGIPNFRIAFKYLEELRSTRYILNTLGREWIKASPNPFSGTFNVYLHSTFDGIASIRLLDMGGKEFQRLEQQVQDGLYYSFRFTVVSRLPGGLYLIEYRDKQKSTVIKVVKQR